MPWDNHGGWHSVKCQIQFHTPTWPQKHPEITMVVDMAWSTRLLAYLAKPTLPLIANEPASCSCTHHKRAKSPPPPPPKKKKKNAVGGGGGGGLYMHCSYCLSVTDLPQALMNTIMWQYSHTGRGWYCLFNILTQTTFNRLTLPITATKPQHKPVYTLTSFVWWHPDKPRPQDPNCLPLWIVWPSNYLGMQRCCVWWLQCIVLQVVYWLVHSGLHSTWSLQCSVDLPQVWQHKLYILHI